MSGKARDLWVGVWVTFVGVAFLMETSRIEGDSEGLVGPMLTPLLVSSLIVLFGVIQGVVGLVKMRKSDAAEENPLDPMKPMHLAAVIAIGAGYMVLFPLIGYFFSTLIALVLSLLLFGNRLGAKFAAVALIGTVVYQIVFIDVMNIHDPAAAFSLRALFG